MVVPITYILIKGSNGTCIVVLNFVAKQGGVFNGLAAYEDFVFLPIGWQ